MAVLLSLEVIDQELRESTFHWNTRNDIDELPNDNNGYCFHINIPKVTSKLTECVLLLR